MEMNNFHRSVLLQEAIHYLNITSGEKYIDATIGGGGHTRAILDRGGKVLGIDADDEAIKHIKGTVSTEDLVLAAGNFKDLQKIATKNNFKKVAGILFDLGVSNHQLDTAERGFSFMYDAALDMRMTDELIVTAADLVNGLTKNELLELFTKYGEESNAFAIVRQIIRSREKKRIETTRELAQIVERVFPHRGKIHPATKIFQALRIAVNDELNNLRDALPQAVELLQTGGRLVIISFHSLEDRIVKNDFMHFESRKLGTVLTKHPVIPSVQEINENRRSRSAKLRAFEKTSDQ